MSMAGVEEELFSGDEGFFHLGRGCDPVME